MYMYLYQAIYLSIYLSICLSVYLSIYLSIYIHMHIGRLRRRRTLGAPNAGLPAPGHPAVCQS